MSPDQLDELLDRSAPATQAADASDLDAMITAARFEAAPLRRPRSRAIAAGAVLTVLLLGGAGAAAATDGLDWAPWAQHPVGAVPFTMSNGFECELRFSEWTGGADPLFVAQVNTARADWHRSTDVVAEVQAILPDVLEQLDETMVWSTMGDENGEGAEVIDEPVPTTPEDVQHRAWTREWQGWDQAVSQLEHEHLVSVGLFDSERMDGAEARGQIQCRDLDGELYVPGAGS